MKQKITLLLLFLSVSIFGDTTESYYDKARKEMVNVIERDVESTRGYLGRDKLGENVITALGRVLRHEFVLPISRKYAYENRPLYWV